ncbi:SpoIID/LytB domain-containing protein [candidate division KSB1 bacterium]|nr:SpoIID/LytB domain-containing protein [candidate division KSB1 bacterium]
MSESTSSLKKGIQKGNTTSLTKTPIVRIGLKEKRDSLEFRTRGSFSIINNEGVAILKNMITPEKWRIKVERQYRAKYAYNILINKFDAYDRAEELTYRLIEKGIGAQITTIGDEFWYEKKVVNDNSQYRVIVDNFETEQEARSFADMNLNNYQTSIIKQKIKEPGALLEVYDFDFEKVTEAENLIRLVPGSDDVITNLYEFQNEQNGQHKTDKFRSFQGALEFRCDDDGRLLIINETPLEKYVESVITSAVPGNLPLDSLKALATTVRSKSIAGLGIQHYNDPFDFCDRDHCSAFYGVKNKSGNITKAVQETLGEVIVKDQNIYDADFNMICGGISEARHTTDLANPYKDVTSFFDSTNDNLYEKFGELDDNKNIRKWIDAEPDVHCNMSGINGSNHFQKYFRWETTFSRKELEDIISEKEARLIGILYDIIPVKRNKAGKLIEMEIIASNVNLILSGQRNIREYLAPQMLNSACFYILKEYDDEGLPYAFIFRGAGRGHGIGLCLAGSVSMAHNGVNYKTILNHYFKETKVRKIY